MSTSEHTALCCYQCLRQGNAVITNDTEYGMVSLEQLGGDVTHGIPGPAKLSATNQGIQAGLPNEDGWRKYRVEPQDIVELTRTPSYVTWQGERWPFHCGRIMPYIGEWKPIDFADATDSDAVTLFNSIVDDASETAWEFLGGAFCCYMHRCQECGQLRGYFDCD